MYWGVGRPVSGPPLPEVLGSRVVRRETPRLPILLYTATPCRGGVVVQYADGPGEDGLVSSLGGL